MKKLLILVLAVFVGCESDLEQKSLVLDFRVLGASSSPAEFIYQGKPPSELEIELSVLVVDPRTPEAMVDIVVEACVFESDNVCIPMDTSPLVVSSMTLGSGNFTCKIAKDHIDASFEADPFMGIFGAAVWMLGTISHGEEEISLLRSVLVTPDGGLGRTPNQSPLIREILVGEEGEEVAIELDDLGRWRFVAGQTERLLPLFDPDDKEEHTVPTFNFDPSTPDEETAPDNGPKLTFTEVSEILSIDYYTDLGVLGTDSNNDKEKLLLTEEDEDKSRRFAVEYSTDPGGTGEGTIWFIASYNFGGVSWVELPILIVQGGH